MNIHNQKFKQKSVKAATYTMHLEIHLTKFVINLYTENYEIVIGAIKKAENATSMNQATLHH